MVAIKAQNLVKKFGSFIAVDNLSIEVLQGEVFGFLGPNGAGKSTSINMICGLLKPTSGEVFILGKKISDSKEIKSKVGLCTQENIFWPRLTCFEQIVFLGEMYDMKTGEAQKRANKLLDDMGLSEKRNKCADTLSGGMKRRLNICLALVQNPEIVVFDEPEAGLDPQSRVLVREFILSVAREKTVILTTHNMDEAERIATRVAIIDKGKLLVIDTPDDLKKSIGEGDILEIKLKNPSDEMLRTASAVIINYSPDFKIESHSIIIRTKNLIEKIADITNALKEKNIAIGELNMRSNSLEDVFINLTGRKLRE
ncbi:MAG: ABC transporter ATP-binding protein [Bacteroidetes bacterium]|nr:ABC transporter ATP-binding protein [Bacteroidota bacterium]